MPINGNAEQAERDVMSLSDLIGDADKLAERAENLAGALERLRQGLTGDSVPGEPANVPRPPSAGHLGALEARLDRISAALRGMESCHDGLIARIGGTPMVEQDFEHRARTVKYAGIDDPHLYPETR